MREFQLLDRTYLHATPKRLLICFSYWSKQITAHSFSQGKHIIYRERFDQQTLAGPILVSA